MPIILLVGTANPFMFREAIVIFALRTWFFGAWLGYIGAPCEGGYWWVPRGAP